jgi:hypothetical protein
MAQKRLVDHWSTGRYLQIADAAQALTRRLRAI